MKLRLLNCLIALAITTSTYKITKTSCPNCANNNNSINYPANAYYTVDYFGVPETYYVTPKDKAEYLYNAYVHRDWDEDDMYDKMYYDRPKGAIQSYFAGRVPDDDFDTVY